MQETTYYLTNLKNGFLGVFKGFVCIRRWKQRNISDELKKTKTHTTSYRAFRSQIVCVLMAMHI
jgi:hypothetical protein